MLKTRNLNDIKIDEGKLAVAEFFGLTEKDVLAHEAPNTYIVDISENTDAQEQFKTIMPYGNAGPKRYKFDKAMLFFWDGTKVKPA